MRKTRKTRVIKNAVKGEKNITTVVMPFIFVQYLNLYFLSEEILEDDDLELLEENTGGYFRKKSRLSKLRDLSRSPASSKRLTVVESSDDDLEMGERPRVVDISKIWDDRDEDEDIDDFIEYSDEDVAPLNQAAREARREEKRQELRRKRAQVRPELVGIDAKYVSASISTF